MRPQRSRSNESSPSLWRSQQVVPSFTAAGSVRACPGNHGSPAPSQLSGGSTVGAVSQVARMREAAAFGEASRGKVGLGLRALSGGRRPVSLVSWQAVQVGTVGLVSSCGSRPGHGSLCFVGRSLVPLSVVWANPSIERTAVGKPPAAAHVERSPAASCSRSFAASPRLTVRTVGWFSSSFVNHREALLTIERLASRLAALRGILAAPPITSASAFASAVFRGGALEVSGG